MKKSLINKKISILIPVYNEEKTIEKILEKVLKETENLNKEIIVINDGSTNRTLEILQKFQKKITLINFNKNQGKGAALRAGLEKSKGEITIFQDADLEYDPKDYLLLLEPILQQRAQVVYGSRNLSPQRHGYKRYLWGGKLLTGIINFLFGTHLTDINTGYKVFVTDILKKLKIESSGFEVCEELTLKALRQNLKILEVPISYSPRTFKEGKKIKWLDGPKAILTIFKYYFK